MKSLEARYRAALRWYPKSWRSRNEDAILGVLMDGADGRETPRASEVVNLAAHGLLSRVALLADIVPRGVRDAASSVALGFGFGLTLLILVMQEWAPWATSEAPNWVPGAAVSVQPVVLGIFTGWGAVVYLAWAVAFVLFAIGLRTAARVTLLGSILFSLGLVLVDRGEHWWSRPPGLSLILLAALAVIVVFGNPLRRPRQWLAVLATFVCGAVAVLYPLVNNVEITSRLNPRSIWTLVLGGSGFGELIIFILGTLLALALIVRWWRWAGAFLVMSALWCSMSIVRLIQNGYTGPAWLAAGALMLAIAAIVSVRLSGYRLRIVREPRGRNAVD